MGTAAHIIGPGVTAELIVWQTELEAAFQTWRARHARWRRPDSAALLVAYSLDQPDEPAPTATWATGVSPATLPALDAAVTAALAAAGLVTEDAITGRRSARYVADPGVMARTDVWIADAADWQHLETLARTQVPFGVRHANATVPPAPAPLRLVSGGA